MTDFPTTRHKAARAGFDAAKSRWRIVAHEVLERIPSDLTVAAAGDPAALRAIEKHRPFLSGDSVRCSWCLDPDDSACGDPQCCGSPDHLTFPCKPLTDALTPYGVDPAGDLPPFPVWGDFYREPDVTFTLAHHSKVGGTYLPPLTEVTLPLSQAVTYRHRMTAASREAVERIDQA